MSSRRHKVTGKILRLQTGQSMMEVVVALAMGILIVTALSFATIFSIRNASFSKASVQATKLAQEGIERVRSGRDKNACFKSFEPVKSWNGENPNCTEGSTSIWDTTIINNGCDNPPPPVGDGGKCYFKVDPQGVLTNIGYGQTTFPTSLAEGIPAVSPIFRRAVLLTDKSSSATKQKEVTVVVTWTDAAGPHESRLTTILGKP